MPLELCNAPSTFQRLMNSVMHGYTDDFVLVYLDDILVFSNTEDEHESVEAGKYTSWLGMLKRAWWMRGLDEDGRVWMVAGVGLKMMGCL